jgi:hypothetical protein
VAFRFRWRHFFRSKWRHSCARRRLGCGRPSCSSEVASYLGSHSREDWTPV